MAIKIQGTTVIDDSRNLVNIVTLTGTTINATTVNSADATFSGTSAIKLPSGTTAQQPVTPSVGMFRYNSEKSIPEYYNGSDWLAAAGGSSAKSYYFGTNG